MKDNGHAVTLLTPNKCPALFAGGTLVSHALDAFFLNTKPDLVLLSNGVSLDEEAMALARSCGITVGVIEGLSVAWGKEHAAVAPFPLFPAADRGYTETPLANFIACPPCFICVQDAKGETLERLVSLSDRLNLQGCTLPIRCFGAGWPQPFASPDPASDYVYASRNAVAAIVVGPAAAEESSIRLRLALPHADGVPVFGLAVENSSPLVAEGLQPSDSEEDLVKLLVRAAQLTGPVSEWCPPAPQGAAGAYLDLNQQMESMLDHLRNAGCLGTGSKLPARSVAILGYFGENNFGDELILAQLTKQLSESYPLVSVCAVCANAHEAFLRHGVETLELSEHVRLSEILDDASVALVVAGLLFDQGVRWTCGLGELASDARASDFAGIVNYTLLAKASDTPVLLYGVGDGPLELEDSRRLVALIAALGGSFYPRNQRTAELLAFCGVPSEQVSLSADTLFGLEAPSPHRAHLWGKSHDLDFAREGLFVVSLRDWPGFATRFEEAVAAELDRIAVEQTLRIVFVSLDPQDQEIHTRIFARMQQQNRAVLYGNADDFDEVLPLFACARAGLALRLHCSLVLNCFGVPCVGVAYLPKVESLFAAMEQNDLLLPLDFDRDALAAALDRLFATHTQRHNTLVKCVDGQRSLLAPSQQKLAELAATPKAAHERRFYCTRQSNAEALKKNDEAQKRCISDLQKRLRAATDACAHVQEVESELAETYASHSFRLGWALMSLPSKVKSFLTRNDSSQKG